MRTDCPVTIEKLGNSTWNLLHTIAAYYPLKPTLEQKKNASALMDLLGKVSNVRFVAVVTSFIT